jgi:hypothetical protein
MLGGLWAHNKILRFLCFLGVENPPHLSMTMNLLDIPLGLIINFHESSHA